jgi:hypothetical protein
MVACPLKVLVRDGKKELECLNKKQYYLLSIQPIDHGINFIDPF